MVIPEGILWGVAGFITLAAIRFYLQTTKDLNHAFTKIRIMEKVLISNKLMPPDLTK